MAARDAVLPAPSGGRRRGAARGRGAGALGRSRSCRGAVRLVNSIDERKGTGRRGQPWGVNKRRLDHVPAAPSLVHAHWTSDDRRRGHHPSLLHGPRPGRDDRGDPAPPSSRSPSACSPRLIPHAPAGPRARDRHAAPARARASSSAPSRSARSTRRDRVDELVLRDAGGAAPGSSVRRRSSRDEPSSQAVPSSVASAASCVRSTPAGRARGAHGSATGARAEVRRRRARRRRRRAAPRRAAAPGTATARRGTVLPFDDGAAPRAPRGDRSAATARRRPPAARAAPRRGTSG